jgi:T4 RnlA family RNA ligase
MYPVINNISDLLPWIRGNDNFSVNYKPGYIVVDYILNTPELFKNEWEKECRGIIFDANTGVVLSRPYHKFFNINEREESTLGYDFLDAPHVVLEKLDGSMIRCFKVGDRWIWGSKAGETFLTPQIEEFVKDKPEYMKFVEKYAHWTLIWEWCSRKNRIVVDHPKDRLVLTAMRHNKTGLYMDYKLMRTVARCFNVEFVKLMDMRLEEVSSFGDENFEGIVLRFNPGHMIKVKTEKYLRYHRAKDSITREKNVVSILVNNEADDFRTLLSPDDRVRFERFENDFFYWVGHESSFVHRNLKRWMELEMTKKEFALLQQKNVKPLTRRIFFKYLEGNDTPDKTVIYYDMINILRGKVNNQAAVDEARQIFHVNWNDYIIGDNENET